jgi:hypothetical protein
MQRSGFAAFLLALGIAAAGLFVGLAMIRTRQLDRFVQVQGVAEQDVTADLAVWPIRVTASADDLGTAQAQINRSTQQVLDFLARHSIDAEATELQRLAVNDATTNRSQPRVGPRFVLEQTLLVRSAKPPIVRAAGQGVGELVSAGVILAPPAEAPGPQYVYTRVNTLRPALLSEAAANARKAAQQLADDAGAHRGAIRQASVARFELLPHDDVPGQQESAQMQKRARMVVTVQYYLR